MTAFEVGHRPLRNQPPQIGNFCLQEEFLSSEGDRMSRPVREMDLPPSESSEEETEEET